MVSPTHDGAAQAVVTPTALGADGSPPRQGHVFDSRELEGGLCEGEVTRPY